MHNSSHRALHLREILCFARVFDQPTNLDNLVLISMVSTHGLVSSSQPIPSLLSHRSIESVAELEANLLGDALFRGQLLESRQVSHLVSDELHGAVGTVEI